MKRLSQGVLFSFLLSQSAFAMGRGAPTDPPTQPVPAACAVKDYGVVGEISRKMETSYATNPGGCVQQCAGGVCEDFFCVSTTCRQIGKTITIPDDEISSRCEEFTEGYSLLQGRVFCDGSAPWTMTVLGGSYPGCASTIESQTIEVRYRLTSEEFKKAQCSQLYACISQVGTDDDILLVKQWQNQFGCVSASK